MCVDHRSFGAGARWHDGRMATYVVEHYLSRHAAGEPDATIARISLAANELTAGGIEVRYLRSIFIPDDETCLILVAAESAASVTVAVRRAGLDPARITEARAEDGASIGAD
jgi:hypothetical protein